jgi:hypothetical protein
MKTPRATDCGRATKSDVVDNETPTWADLTGDKRKGVICTSGGFMGYAEPNWSKPAEMWTWHSISPKINWQRFTHGLGYGDVNGDGRMDILEAGGWWEQPASLAGDPQWQLHPRNSAAAAQCIPTTSTVTD